MSFHFRNSALPLCSPECQKGEGNTREWPVFPLRDKRPLVTHGFYQATTDEACIHAWWTRWPWANIGIPTRTRTGIWVVDVDVRHDGFASLQKITAHVA